MIYKFVSHPITHEATPPAHPMFDLFRKVADGLTLTREEKNQIVRGLYGLFGAGGSTFKNLGWAAPFYDVLPKFWVQTKYGDIRAYYAPDKTALRAELPDRSQIVQIVEVPGK